MPVAAGLFNAFLIKTKQKIIAAMSGKHPIHVHPARPLYRFAATALGASMWFFVSDIYPPLAMSGFLKGQNAEFFILQ